MSFFQKDQTEKNLQYDDIAFLHFILTMSLTSVVIFGYLVYTRLRASNIQNIKNYKKLKNTGLFAKQIERESIKLKQQNLSGNFFVYAGLLIGSIIISVGIAVFVGSHTTQMIGFDPHQILGVAPEATVNQIKKAYRKLALEFHPDRNPNNPEAHAKFIMISKSYECLTDQQKKQNCLKYGNPDGQASFQVGIGLPKFIISKQNQFVILPIVFFILLFVVPMIILKWSGSLKAKDNFGLDIENYQLLYKFYRPQFNASFGFYLVTVLKQLQTDKKLTQKQKSQFLAFLTQKKIIDINYVSQGMSQGQLYTLHKLFKQMAQKQPDSDLCKVVPDLLNSLMKFSLIFAKRINDKKPLFHTQLPINWIGTQHIFMLLEFTKTFYNSSLFNPTIFTPFDYLELQKQDREISFKNPLNNLREILKNEDKKLQHLSLFPEHHREHIERQLNDLPILNLEVKCMLGTQQVHEFTVEDFPNIHFKVTKQNQTSGYCYIPQFPYLRQEKYYFVLLYGSNLMHFHEVIFQEGKQEFVGKFQYRQSFAKDMKFYAFILSESRYGLDDKTQLSFNVKDLLDQQKNKEIQFHKQDLTIEKQPKSYFEKMLSLQIENPSDNELSDTEDQETEGSKPKKKGGLKMQEQRGGCKDNCCH